MTIKQIWECPRCGRKYESPVRLTAISCSKFGSCKAMKLTEDMDTKPTSLLPTPGKAKLNSKTSKGTE